MHNKRYEGTHSITWLAWRRAAVCSTSRARVISKGARTSRPSAPRYPSRMAYLVSSLQEAQRRRQQRRRHPARCRRTPSLQTVEAGSSTPARDVRATAPVTVTWLAAESTCARRGMHCVAAVLGASLATVGRAGRPKRDVLLVMLLYLAAVSKRSHRYVRHVASSRTAVLHLRPRLRLRLRTGM